VQTVPGFAKGLGDGLPRFVAQEGYGGLFKGLTPLWGRQIPYTMMKFGELPGGAAPGCWGCKGLPVLRRPQLAWSCWCRRRRRPAHTPRAALAQPNHTLAPHLRSPRRPLPAPPRSRL
jgi:hypothetical protein